MDKNTFIKKIEEIVSKSELDDISDNFDFNNSCAISFIDDSGVDCDIEFGRKSFGMISYLHFRRNRNYLLNFKLSKNEWLHLKGIVIDRIESIKKKELGLAFKDIHRDNKINEVVK